MSRWIDADAIEDKAKQYSLGYYEEDEWAVPFKEINSAPSIDIVRCKECKYRDYWGSCTFLQNKGDAHKPIMTDADDFCSCGERKDEPQTEDDILREQCKAFIDIVNYTERSKHE